ncbi:MAG: DNA repair protein RecN [Myxococcales bacterium]
MLTCLRIRDLAIIEQLEIELGPGLNVLTGETGAGKSILVDALELVLGGKGKAELVRSGAAQAEVEALFDLGDDPELREKLRALEVECEGELLIRRVLLPNGRTRAFVNGRMATAQQLSELSRGLADISSQHEHHTLTNAATHLGYLDAFASLASRREQVASAYSALREAHVALQAFDQRVQDRAQREDLLRYQVREIEEVSPRVGEEGELSEQRDRLKHAGTLMRLSADAAEALYERDGSVSEVLAQASSHVLEAATLDASLRELAQQLESVRAQLEDAARELSRYTRSVQADPDALTDLEERLHALQKLKRKYGGTLENVLAHLAQSQAELAALEDHEGTSERLRSEYQTKLGEARGVARELSKQRRLAAGKLASAISEELTSLGMGGARILVDVSPLEGKLGELEVDGARLSAHGIDRAEFLIAPNRGEQARPLSKVASGGELSRAMLAIKRVLAGLGPAGMYVFDEVDSGVGGAVAEVIGRKIEEVSEHRQVLCITHLPQIAVFAKSHFKVEKASQGERTVSTVKKLSKREQEEEIARMLGGLKITAKTRAAAAEMLREARAVA